MDYIIKQELPKRIKEKEIIIHDVITSGWYYDDAKELIEWLKSSGHIVSAIHVYLRSHDTKNLIGSLSQSFNLKNEPYYFGYSWTYKGISNLSKEENFNSNFTSAYKFVEDINRKSKHISVYEIFSESEILMDEIEKEFYYKAIISSGHNYRTKDALELVERCRSIGKRLYGVEVSKITDSEHQPIDVTTFSEDDEELDPSTYLERFHIKKNNDFGNWGKATQLIKEEANKGYCFLITHE